MIQEFGSIQIVQFEILSAYKELRHGFSTRHGGKSTGIFSTMNLGMNRGDDRQTVLKNFQLITQALQMPYENLVLSAQTHTTNIRVVTEEDKGKGIIRPLDYQDVDGLITNIPQLPLVTFYADCVPLLFFDPVQRVIGTSHSGWRGTVQRMGHCTVEKMKEVYGCRPSDIIACIGPSICRSCYEVDENVATAFFEEFQGEGQVVFPKGKIPLEKFPEGKIPLEKGKYLVDLQKSNRIILESAGVLPQHIEDVGLCTCCDPELFFSHRASGGKRGNLAAFIMLQS